MNNLGLRVVSALILVTLLTTMVLIHPMGVLIAFGLLVTLSCIEYLAMVHPGRSATMPVLVMLGLYFLMYFLTRLINPSGYFIFIILMAILHLVILYLILIRSRISSIRHVFPGVILITMAASCVHYFQYRENYGIELLILLSLIWASDTGSYFMGKYFGKRPLAPAISPNKTVEGFVGGFLLAWVWGLVLYLYQIISIDILYVATVVHIFVVLGDLLESRVKRILGVKDSGRLIPGHGGILDRADGLLFSLPFALIAFHYLILIKQNIFIHLF